MIDTIRLKSPYISYSLYEKLRKISLRKLCITSENDIVYEFVSHEMKTTFHNKIVIKLNTQEWKKVFFPSSMKYETIKVDCEPYIELELSIHKFFLGHNIYGGSNDLKLMMLHFEKFLKKNISEEIPNILDWEIIRLDYAEVFKIDFIDELFYLLNNCNFPRRKVVKYPSTLYFPGSTTTLKFYDKNKEFLKHGRNKIPKNLELQLIKYSEGILRVEVEIKRRKFIYDNGKLYTIRNFEIEYAKKIYENEVNKVMNIREENKLICEYNEVQSYLMSKYSNQMARTLLMTYTSLSVLGENETRKNMTDRTYYRHRKELKDNNISWENSDLRVESKVYKFIPNNTSQYILDIDCIKPMLEEKAV